MTAHKNVRPELERIMAAVVKTEGCWLWRGAQNDKGYGVFSLSRTRKKVYVHRRVYELLVGEIPAGLTIDHLCRVRNCVNPQHLEAVTQRENLLRGQGVSAHAAKKTSCSKGHPLSGDNVAIYRYRYGTYRRCLTCQRERNRQKAVKNLQPNAFKNENAAIADDVQGVK